MNPPHLHKQPFLSRHLYPAPGCPLVARLILATVAGMGLLLSPVAVLAENSRIVVWNLELGGKWLDSNSALRNAAVLHELNPDILILYDVPDWKACQQLAAALEPVKYSVHVCSAFPAAGKATRSARQVAILSRRNAYFSWSEEWLDPTRTGGGGFAFAALQAGRMRVGFFVVDAPETTEWGPASPESVPWAKAVGTFKQWATNKLDAALVAFRAPKILDANALDAGLARPFGKSLAVPSGSANSFSASLPADPATLPVLLFGQAPLLCDLDVAPGNPIEAKGRRVDPSITLLNRQSFLRNPMAIGAAAAAAGLVLVLLFMVAGLRRRVRRLAAPPAVALLGTGDLEACSATVLIAARSATVTSLHPAELLPQSVPLVSVESDYSTSTQSQVLRSRDASAETSREPLRESVKAGVISNLTQWLKSTFIRRVLADRELLARGQREAVDKAVAMDERLAGIELQIQQQTHIYEQRILELTRELEETREENRALILARIAQVKVDLEAVRSRIARSAL